MPISNEISRVKDKIRGMRRSALNGVAAVHLLGSAFAAAPIENTYSLGERKEPGIEILQFCRHGDSYDLPGVVPGGIPILSMYYMDRLGRDLVLTTKREGFEERLDQAIYRGVVSASFRIPQVEGASRTMTFAVYDLEGDFDKPIVIRQAEAPKC